MTNFIKERADELGLSSEDIAFELRRSHNHKLTSAAVRAWFAGTVPALELAEPLAAVLKLTKQRVLSGMHEMAKDRQQAKQAAAAN